MRATILRQGELAPEPENVDDPPEGTWVSEQDPLTHEIIRVWHPVEVVPDDPSTPDVNEQSLFSTPCMARGIMEGGIRVAGTTERWGDTYENIDFIRLWTPPHIVLSKRDRVTNIRNSKGQILWKDEETNPLATSNWRATQFDVLGVTPEVDAFGVHTANVAMCEKAEVHVDA